MGAMAQGDPAKGDGASDLGGRDLDDGPGPGDARLGAGHTHTLFSDIALTILRRMGYETGRRKLTRQGRWSDPYWARLGNPFLFPSSPVSVCLFLLLVPFLDTIVGTCNERLLYDCIRDVSSID
jgi:hypothetical protein